MSEFVYLYRGGQTNQSPEARQQNIQKWMVWFKDLGDKGHVKSIGQPLERTGKLVKGKQKAITDGPFAEAKELVGGFALIQTQSREEAVEFTKTFMNIAGDGETEIRQLYDASPMPQEQPQKLRLA